MPTVTYNVINTTTFSSLTANYTISSIPSTYRTLRLVVEAAGTQTNYNVLIRPNSNSTSTKIGSNLYASGTTKSYYIGQAAAYWEADIGMLTNQTNNPTIYLIDFINYSNTANTIDTGFIDSVMSTTSDTATSMYQNYNVAATENTAAIHTLLIYPSGGNFAIGDRITLFGLG